MQEFINPKSMLTPGVAGSLMMFLVNGIAFQFPEISARYLALFLSFLIGAIVWFSETSGKSAVLQKAVYWMLNSLVIFVVGFGTANLAVDASAGTSRTGMSHSQLLPFVSTAFAQGAPTQGVSPPPATKESQSATNGSSGTLNRKALEEQLKSQQAENESLRRQLESVQQQSVTTQQKKEQQFFKRW